VSILNSLKERWDGIDYPFLVHATGELYFSDLQMQESADLTDIKCGDVVALVGDFDPLSIVNLLKLLDKKAIIVPLTQDTSSQHQYFLDSAHVDYVIIGNDIKKINHDKNHPLIEKLRKEENGGLILFSTGTTGQPKAILHNLKHFLKRFETPRPTLKTINFLLFDHIGGLNTLLHTLFNKGTVVAPKSRSVPDILETCSEHEIEVLPTTPTFLRMMLMSGLIPKKTPSSLKIITYGTERMDQPTLDSLCKIMPNIDFRQTFGMSELGIVRVKSESRQSLFMKIGGDGVETRVKNNILQIRSESRMLGYLNSPSPFDDEGWYDTKDVVEVKGEYFKVTGRDSDVVNVGGLKFMASEVERVALGFPNISLVKVISKENPITGQHVEMYVQPKDNTEVIKTELIKFLKDNLQSHMVPRRIKIQKINVGHRFKKQ